MACSKSELPCVEFPKKHLVTIVRILDPITFILKECPNDNMSKSARDFIQLESSVLSVVDDFNVQRSDIIFPRKGTYVIVKPKTGCIWSRGRVDLLLETAKEILASVYLVDEGITISVSPRNLRYPAAKMFEVPFQAFEFVLYKLKPLSLSFNEDLLLRRMPSDRWDAATYNFVQDFLAGKNTVEIEVQKRDSNGRFYGKLFSPIDEEVCLNEELVDQGYAYYEKHQNASPISKYRAAALQNDSGSDSGVHVEEKLPVVATATKNVVDVGWKIETNNSNPPNSQSLEFNFQKLNIVGPSQPSSIGRGFSRRKRNLEAEFCSSLPVDNNSNSSKLPLQSTLVSTSEPPQHSSIPNLIPTAGFGRGVFKYKNTYLDSETEREPSQNMDILKLLTKRGGSNFKPQKDEINCDLNSSSRSSSQLSGSKSEALDVSSQSSSRMSQLMEYSKIIASGDKTVSKEAVSTSSTKKENPQPFTSRFNMQKFIEVAKSRTSNKENSSRPSLSSDVSNVEIEVQAVNSINRSEDSHSELVYSERSTTPAFESYQKFCQLSKKNRDDEERKTTELQSEGAGVSSPEWERYKKYTKILRGDKNATSRKKTSEEMSNPLLKPLPPLFSREATVESFVESQSVSVSPIYTPRKSQVIINRGTTSRKAGKVKNVAEVQSVCSSPASTPRKSYELGNHGSEMLNRVNNEGVLSFIHENEPSNENTYMLRQSLDVRVPNSPSKEDLEKCGIVNVICLGNQVPTPSMQINDYCFEDRINKALRACKIKYPTVLQSYMWPTVLRGRNCAAIGLKNAGKTLGYAVPILNDFSLEGKYDDLPTGAGPLVIVLCSNWMVCQKVQEDFDKCNQFSNRFNTLTIHGGDNIDKKMAEFLRGYEVLVTTPSVILKLMKNDMNINVIERCCHLILDDADSLIEIFLNDMLEFFQEYRKVFASRGKNSSSPSQIIVCSVAWTEGVKSFMKMIINAVLLFSNYLEATIQAEIPFYVDVCKQYQEPDAIADFLGRNSNCNIVICCTTSEHVRNLAAILKSKSFYLLIAHEDMNKPDLDSVKQQWKTSTDCSNHPILVVSDAILPLIEIYNAECLIHYNLPDLSKLQFSNRFSCLRDVISFWHNVPEHERKKNSQLKERVNYIAINEKNTRQSYELMKIMRRINCPVPDQLAKMAKVELMTRQLCDNLLSFGKCDVKEICRERHVFHPLYDKPNEGIPHWGNVDLLITYVVNAGLYYGNILKYRDPNNGQELTHHREQFLILNLDLARYFEGNKIQELVTEPQVDEICAYRGVGGAYFRVQIIEIIPKTSGFTRKVTILSIDEGWTRTVELDRIFVLPKHFAAFPPQAIQIRLCKVKPIDNSNVWTYQANCFANDLVKDKELRGKVVLSFRNCIFVTNLCPNSSLNSCDADSEIISTVSKLKSANYAKSNPNHLDLLMKQCEGSITWTSPLPEKSNVNLSSLVTYESFELNVEKSVFVTSVQSPSLFFTIPVKNYTKLVNLNEKINDLLVKGKLKKTENIRKNALVLGPYVPEQRWFRARITEVIKGEPTIVQLFFPDFGDECSAVEKDIYEIHPDFLKFLPFQAVECSLIGVCAAHGGWSEAAIDSFIDCTREDDDDGVFRKFSLKAMQSSPAVNSNANHYCVSLHFENGLSLADELIKKGLVDDVNRKELKTAGSSDNSTSNNSEDEDVDKLEKEYGNNFQMLLEGFNASRIEEFRGYKLDAANIEQLRAIENQQDKMKNCLDQISKPKHKSPLKYEKSLPKDFYPIPTLNVCKDIPRSQPKITWFQTDDCVIVHFELICTEYFANIGENFLSFRTIRGNKFYDFKEALYSSVIPQDSSSVQLPLYAKFCLKKVEKGVHWPKLVKSNEKKSHITVNLDHIDENDSDSVPQPPYKRKVYQFVKHFDTESSTSDDDLFIEEDFEE